MKKSFLEELVLGDHPITLREYYAGQALAGLLANDTGPAGDWNKSAKDAILAADALIAELERGE